MTVRQVQGQAIDTAGHPIAGALVECCLNVDAAATTSDQVLPVVQQTGADSEGNYTLNLESNTGLEPVGTTYIIKIISGEITSRYQISVSDNTYPIGQTWFDVADLVVAIPPIPGPFIGGPPGPEGPGVRVMVGGGSELPQEPIFNLIAGTSVLVTAADNPGQSRIDVTVALGTEVEGQVTSLLTDLAGTAKKAANLSDLASLPAARSSLGLSPYDLLANGCKGDGISRHDGAMTSGSAVFTSASNVFSAATDIDKVMKVGGAGAGAALLVTTIASVQSATQCTLAAPAGTTVSAVGYAYGTNDTAIILAIIAACPEGGSIPVPVPLGHGYFVDQDLVVTKNVNFIGDGVSEVWGTTAQTGGTQFPGAAPWLAGSVFLQTAPATDGIGATGTGMSLGLHGVGVRFADYIAFNNTGHGINGSPTATVSGGHEEGLVTSRWDDIAIFGHDGNHYAFFTINMNLATTSHLRGYGGGLWYEECDSQVSAFGNCHIGAMYGALIAGGSAHGVHLKSRTTVFPGVLNLITFDRPQVNILLIAGDGTPLANTFTMPAPTGAQSLWLDEGIPQNIRVDAPDLEQPSGAFGSAITFGISTVISEAGGALSAPGNVPPPFLINKPRAGVPTAVLGNGAGVGTGGDSISVGQLGGGPGYNDERGLVSLTAGASPWGGDGDKVCKVTLQSFVHIGAVLLQPYFPGVSAGAMFYISNVTADSFEVWSHLGLTAHTSYAFIYHVVE